MYSSSDLSNKNSSHNNYINKKVYISFSALLLVAGIIIVILGKVKVFNKRKRYNPVRSYTKPSSKKDYVKSRGGIKTKDKFKNSDTYHLQDIITDSNNNGDGLDEGITDTNYQLDSPSDIFYRHLHNSPNNKLTYSELLPTDEGILATLINGENSVQEAENDTTMDSDNVLTNSGKIVAHQPVRFAVSMQKRAHSYPVKHSDYLSEGEIFS